MTAHDAIFAQLPASGEAIAFSHLADSLEDLSHDSVLAGLRVLQTEGRAAIAHGFGWHRVGVHVGPDFDAIARGLLPEQGTVQYFEAGDGPLADPITFRVGELLGWLADAARAGYAARQKEETP